jgi:hypothetical protein
MSFSALHRAHGFRKLCQGCHERKARFQYRGIVRADRDHTLCFECYRSERDRQRSWSLLARARGVMPNVPAAVTFPVTAPSYSGMKRGAC